MLTMSNPRMIGQVVLVPSPREADQPLNLENLRLSVKRSVTIRLDTDVLAWFKLHAANGRYQTEINRILRRHVIAKEKRHAWPCRIALVSKPAAHGSAGVS
jgi:uncharacterized protein (DUF4415 family)